MKKSLVYFFPAFFFVLALVAGCQMTNAGDVEGVRKNANVMTSTVPNSKALTGFGFAVPQAIGTIDENTKAISITVPYGTNVKKLIAIFTSTGTSIKVGAAVQVSGTTQNDFTNSVIYTISAADGSSAYYTVMVTAASSNAKAITAFEFAKPVAIGAINERAKSISVTVPYGTNVSSLTPSIIHTGARISPPLGFAQNFTNPVVYTVIASDNTTVNYTVSVILASSNAKEMTSFKFLELGAIGSINESTKTIEVTVPYGTNVTALKPAIIHTGTNISPVSGSAQNFTGSVSYTVTAADGTTANYSVNVNIGAAPVAHTVTFDQQEGSAVASQTINEGAPVIKPADPMKSGYEFAGWYKDTSYANSWDFAGDMVTTDVTLYAKWAIPVPAYTVIYNANGATGGTVPVDAATYIQGSAVTVKGNTGTLQKQYANSGVYSAFLGWNTAPDGTGTTYSVNSTFTMDTSNVNLYAKWTFVVFSVPNIERNDNSTTNITILGSAFQKGIAVKLTKSGETEITASNVTLGADSIIGNFDLRYKKLGLWTVICTNPDGQTVTGIVCIYKKETDYVNFEYTNYGTYIEITKYIGKSDYVTIPGYILGLPVDIKWAIFQNNSIIKYVNIYGLCSNRIPDKTFSNCTNLISIVFPRSFSIGNYAFENCTNLQYVNEADLITFDGSIVEWNMFSASIGDYAFLNCTGLKIKLNLTKDVYIGVGSFKGCSGIPGVGWQENTTIYACIDNYAFQDCRSLNEISLPNGTQYVLDGTFSGCTNLKRILFPVTMKEIRSMALFTCPLEYIAFESTIPPKLNYKVFDIKPIIKITVPKGSKINYTYADSDAWKEYISKIVESLLD
jgi:uncharacterized repeat protein (TIGR02543 family)